MKSEEKKVLFVQSEYHSNSFCAVAIRGLKTQNEPLSQIFAWNYWLTIKSTFESQYDIAKPNTAISICLDIVLQPCHWLHLSAPHSQSLTAKHLSERRRVQRSSSEARRCFREEEEEAKREQQRQRRLWENHNHASCVWFPASCQDLSLSASQTFSLSYPILLSSPLAALCTPTLDRTQMVWIRSLHDWAVATHEILKSDSLLSLNTPD